MPVCHLIEEDKKITPKQGKARLWPIYQEMVQFNLPMMISWRLGREWVLI